VNRQIGLGRESVGEVMAIGKSFEEAVEACGCSDTGKARLRGPALDDLDRAAIDQLVGRPTRRIFINAAFRPATPWNGC
jgi:carbamoylphosphate synthase large subunit